MGPAPLEQAGARAGGPDGGKPGWRWGRTCLEPHSLHSFPQPVHMSDPAATLAEPGWYPLFHRPYYY